MKETLKQELRSYFKVIDERKRYVEAALNDAKVDLGGIEDNLNKNAELKLHSIIKKFIIEKKFTGRNNYQDRIFLDGDKIGYVIFKHKTMHTIRMVGKYKTLGVVNEWFPAGFTEVIAATDKILEEIKSIDVEYSDERKISLKVAVVDSGGLDRGRIKGVIIKDEKKYGETKSSLTFETNDLYVYGDDKHQFLTEDIIYDTIKSMLEVKMKWKQEVMDKIQTIENILNKFLDEDYHKVLVVARLTQNDKQA